MWTYPSTNAWYGYQPDLPAPESINEGNERDGDFGMKLFNTCKKSGFTIKDCQLDQPLLWTKEQKQGVLSGLIAFKNTALKQGMTEQEWQGKYDETIRIISDPNQIIAFYGSCFIAAKKEA